MKQTVKKVGFLSVIITIVGSTIGAGIFFKNKSILENTQGNIGLAISCWVIAAIGILAIGLALLEVTSVQERDKGILGWVEKFAPKWIFKWTKGYMLLLYFPITFITMPIFATIALQDATGWQMTWWEVMLIACAIFLWFGFLSFFSLKVGNSIQWIFTLAKFIPIVIIPIFGFINLNNNSIELNSTKDRNGLIAMYPYLGIMASIPAIFFAYDGFYSVSSLKEQMKKPKLMPLALAIGIGIITTFYLWITAGVLLGSKDGSPNVYSNNSFRLIMNMLIFIAVLGVVNGFSLGTYNIYDEYIEDEDFAFAKLFKKTRIKDRKISKFTLRGLTPGFIVLMSLSFILLIILCVVGSFFWKVTLDVNSKYTNKIQNLMGLIDLLTNWTSLLIFMVLTVVIIGCLINRLTKIIEVKKSKLFIPSAIISIILTVVPCVFMLLEPIVNMTGFNDADKTKALIKFIALIATVLLSFIPWLIEILTRKIERNRNKKIKITN